MTTFTVVLRPSVLTVLRGRGNSKVSAAIVQGIVVGMVPLPLIARLQPQNLPIHSDGAFLWRRYTSHSIETSSRWTPPSEPFPLGEPFVIRGVNDGDLALS